MVEGGERTMEDLETRLLAEELNHTLDLLNGRIDVLEARMAHADALADLRLGSLERSNSDQEARLRAMADQVVKLTTSTSLAQVMQAAFAVVLSAIAAYLGRR